LSLTPLTDSMKKLRREMNRRTSQLTLFHFAVLKSRFLLTDDSLDWLPAQPISNFSLKREAKPAVDPW
jgi:hypothetical protein